MNFEQLVDLCQRTHEELCFRAARVVDAHLVVRNWLFGHYIAEFEQQGADRAQYGARLLGSLADRLKPLKVRGTSATRLKLYRSFYRHFPIGPTLSDQLSQNDHFRVDLVFYNRLLRCYVLIDLKRDKLAHQDLGQMQMYVNYFDRHVKLPDELPTIGILLCHRKNDALVELTLPKDANIFASKYQLYLPSKEELKTQLEQITHDLEQGEAP